MAEAGVANTIATGIPLAPATVLPSVLNRFIAVSENKQVNEVASRLCFLVNNAHALIVIHSAVEACAHAVSSFDWRSPFFGRKTLDVGKQLQRSKH